tara:strand:+ start:459 stop:2531 length:2073 start_codon:yes stop_codon:yes gene_type:complete
MAVRKTAAGLRLKRWFKEDWRTPRGKKDYTGGENTFRPTKRISKDTPSTWSELSKGEKRRAQIEKNTKGRVSRYKKKNSKKFFLGGLIKKMKKKKGGSGLAAIAGGGLLGVGAMLGKGKAREEDSPAAEAMEEAKSAGSQDKNLEAAVSGGLLGPLYNKAPESKKEQINKILTEAKKGAVVKTKKRKYLKKYEEGGKLKKDADDVSIVPKKESIAKTDSVGDFAKRNVKSEIATQAVSRGSRAAVARGASKAVGRIGARAIPGVGYGLLAADTGKFAMEQRAKAYAELDKKSPGTSRRLETGAYGMQSGAEGLPKTRGTFFGSMKEEGGVVRKYNYGGTTRKNKMVKSSGRRLDFEMLEGSGVLYDRKGTKKMRRYLKSREEKLYREAGNKRKPKRNIFEEGGGAPKVERKRVISERQEERLAKNPEKADRKSEAFVKKNIEGGSSINTAGRTEDLIEDKRGGKNFRRRFFGRKTDKGLVKKKFDDELSRDSDVVAGARVMKSLREQKELGRDQRKFVSVGEDSEGNPLKFKSKRKGKGRDIPTDKFKMKQLSSDESKFVDVSDGKRIKKRGASESDARTYTRKGFRRVYTDPNEDGTFTTLRGKQIGGKKPRKTDRDMPTTNEQMTTESSKKQMKEQKRLENQRAREKKKKMKEDKRLRRYVSRNQYGTDAMGDTYKHGGMSKGKRKYC